METEHSGLTILQAAPTCTGLAEDALCPFGSEQVRRAGDNLYYLISCGNDVGGANTALGNVQVSPVGAIGQCIAACVAFNAIPANAARKRCQYGQIVVAQGPPYSCSLWGDIVYYPYTPNVDDGRVGGANGRNSFILTSNQRLIAGACAIPSQSSSSTTAAVLSTSTSSSVSPTSTTVTTS